MAKVNLFYLTPNPYGGWATYAYHLTRALNAANLEWEIFKVGNNTEKSSRPFVNGLFYRNLCMEDAIEVTMQRPTLIVASAKKYMEACQNLFFEGAHLVVHDPTEFKFLPIAVRREQERCIVIRQTGLQHLPGATFIRHPYEPQAPTAAEKTKLAVSVSRIDFDKRTTILLDANRVSEEMGWEKIDIRGFENRLYTKFKVAPYYPEWVQSVNHFEKTAGKAVELLAEARFMPDMSQIKGDGGGTQYTFLEAWDAGALPVLHRDWIVPGDDMIPDDNCSVTENGENLAMIMQNMPEEWRSEMVENGRHQMRANHSPQLIGHRYREILL